MVRLPGPPPFWVSVAALSLLTVVILPGYLVWPLAPVVALIAMAAAVTRAYQDTSRDVD